ncbi:MAG: SCO family protein [Candidatus Rokuibacteriota bacterium]
MCGARCGSWTSSTRSARSPVRPRACNWPQLQREFSGTPDLRLVSITVDPAHDAPRVLRAYAERYGASERWWFLTGDKREIYCLAREGFLLGVTDPRSPDVPDCSRGAWLAPAVAWASHGSHGIVMHSARMVLVDRVGQIRAYHLATDRDSMTRLRANLRRLLQEPATPAR